MEEEKLLLIEFSRDGHDLFVLIVDQECFRFMVIMAIKLFPFIEIVFEDDLFSYFAKEIYHLLIVYYILISIVGHTRHLESSNLVCMLTKTSLTDCNIKNQTKLNQSKPN